MSTDEAISGKHATRLSLWRTRPGTFQQTIAGILVTGAGLLAATQSPLAVWPCALWTGAVAAGGPFDQAAAPASQEPDRSRTEPEPGAHLTACHAATIGVDARCGWVDVPENRDRHDGRRLRLRIVVLSTETLAARASDPLFVLAGGPGQAASEQAWVLKDFALVRRNRDVVLVDVRGTGDSVPLRCKLPGTDEDPQGYFTDLYSPASISACRQELEATADLTRFTTTETARDLDAVRAALGIERMNLFGTSYGTRLALEYLRRFPRRVRTMTLDAVVSPDMRAPQTFAIDGQRALDMLFKACGADDQCNTAFPDLRTQFDRMRVRLVAGPVSTVVRVREDAPAREVRLGWDVAAETVRGLLYNANSAARLPLMIHRAAAGDYQPLAEARLAARRGADRALALGLFLSVTCAEDESPLDAASRERLTRGTFLGAYRMQQQSEACRLWARGSAPTDFHDIVESDIPALLLSGDLDPVTPPFRSAVQVRALRHSVRGVAPGGAHAFRWSGCADLAIARLIETASTEGLDVSCLARIARPAFVLR